MSSSIGLQGLSLGAWRDQHRACSREQKKRALHTPTTLRQREANQHDTSPMTKNKRKVYQLSPLGRTTDNGSGVHGQGNFLPDTRVKDMTGTEAWGEFFPVTEVGSDKTVSAYSSFRSHESEPGHHVAFAPGQRSLSASSGEILVDSIVCRGTRVTAMLILSLVVAT